MNIRNKSLCISSLLFLLITGLLNGQSYEHEFIGTIQLIDKSLITYKLQFDVDEEWNVKGKSITDFAGAHRTESRIKGKIDDKEDMISFHEYENISTKSDYPDSTFCFVHVKNARIKLNRNKSIIQGHFYGRYADNTICAEADLYLISEDFVLSKMRKVTDAAKVVVKDEKLEKTEAAIEKTNENLANIILEKDEEFKYATSSEMIELRIFDPEYEDGDVISLYINGRTVLSKYSVKKKAKIIRVKLEGETTRIRLVANYEGKLPPNSANIELVDNDDISPLKLKLNQDSEVFITIKKQIEDRKTN